MEELCVAECWLRTSPQHVGVTLGFKAWSAGVARLVSAVPVSSLGKLGTDSTV